MKSNLSTRKTMTKLERAHSKFLANITIHSFHICLIELAKGNSHVSKSPHETKGDKDRSCLFTFQIQPFVMTTFVPN